MSTRDQQQPTTRQSAALPARDASDRPVDVVERDIRDEGGNTGQVDKVITPSSIRAKEQDAETLRKKASQVEQKLADD
jgi:hypothetical protein